VISGQKKLRFSSEGSNLHLTSTPSFKKALPMLRGNHTFKVELNPSPHESQVLIETGENFC